MNTSPEQIAALRALLAKGYPVWHGLDHAEQAFEAFDALPGLLDDLEAAEGRDKAVDVVVQQIRQMLVAAEARAEAADARVEELRTTILRYRDAPDEERLWAYIDMMDVATHGKKEGA